ncbi:MAG: hypothetical protein GF349_02545 [Candidatus Magasanikbacteria bacterium]|nr:hypothetical protein [Candidatus Magasanikbacteria bacterium]
MKKIYYILFLKIIVIIFVMLPNIARAEAGNCSCNLNIEKKVAGQVECTKDTTVNLNPFPERGAMLWSDILPEIIGSDSASFCDVTSEVYPGSSYQLSLRRDCTGCNPCVAGASGDGFYVSYEIDNCTSLAPASDITLACVYHNKTQDEDECLQGENFCDQNCLEADNYYTCLRDCVNQCVQICQNSYNFEGCSMRSGYSCDDPDLPGSAYSLGTSGQEEIPESERVNLINPIGGTEEDPTGTVNVTQILGNVVSTALGVLGSVALVVFVYGGFVWLTSGGNEERVSKGLKAMLWAAVGIFIVFASYAILSLIISTITAG